MKYQMIQNMRDLGKLLTMDGKKIRTGMLIRSAHLSQAEKNDLEGVSTIIDLRTPGERNKMPDQIYGRQYLTMPLFDDVTAGMSHENETEQQILPDMANLYRLLMRECTGNIRNVILTIMGHNFNSGAILWHCSEGKDRCGMITALILEALGVDRSQILEDYLKTNLVNQPKATRVHDELIGTHGKEFAESVYQAYIADERYLLAAWEEMGADYLKEKLRIPCEAIDSFRETVLEK